jgi:hypothetical protein
LAGWISGEALVGQGPMALMGRLCFLWYQDGFAAAIVSAVLAGLVRNLSFVTVWAFRETGTAEMIM